MKTFWKHSIRNENLQSFHTLVKIVNFVNLQGFWQISKVFEAHCTFSESESESDSDDSNDSEYDEDIMLAREILAGKSSLYRENEINEIPDDLPALGRSKPLQEPINVGGKQTKEDNIGSRIMESQEKRIYHRCISALGDVNFRHAYK